ncbi:pseudouridine synthase [Methylobacterium radiodurans]|uniref:Pseudouridine synthase n=1 Tax=Methylobacterium radiodurans TaxID=2202828 RepID=A0A2U8VS61_9HYPH|nr:pseudouridine synthase [Methylobacterium radiodurans]AWN36505.1 RNA-binding protein [Methylobacterium radiodurans]
MSDNSSESGRDGRADDPSAQAWTPATDANTEKPDSERRPKARDARAERAGGDAPLRRRAPEHPAKPTAPSEAPEESAYEGERIAKAIARAGIASRRDAEAMIAAGRVSLNGQVLDSPAVNVTESDRILIDGEPMPERERTRLWIFHKPRGLVTTARDPEGRQTVFEALPEDMPRVVAVGRLDINTEGLLLLTNDGGLAKVIAHPDTGWLRRYRVRAHGDTDQAQLDRLRKGVTIDGMEYGPVEATLDRVQGDNLWITMGLREGKNREVKRILEHLGLQVNRLIRLSFGPFQLGDLEMGLTEEVRTKVLKEQLGKTLAEQAGVDFESPVREPIAPFGSPKQKEAARQDAGRQEAGRQEARTERADRGERGERSYRDGGERGERPARPARPAAAPERVPTGGMGPGPRRSVWRADEGETQRPGRPPRRGADPKIERAAAAERGRERVGAIKSGERRVLVERLGPSPQPEPAAEPPKRRPRYAKSDEAGAPRADARPRYRSGDEARGERAARADRAPRPDRAARTDRPARAERAPRGEGAERAPRRAGGSEGGGRSGDRGFGERGYGEARGTGPRDAGARPGGKFGDRKPGGSFGGGKPGGAKFGGRPGAAKSGGSEGGGYKAGPKPGGRPGGFGGRGEGAPTRGGRPGGKPGGFKSGGFKPGGGGPGGRSGGGGRPPRGAR